MILNQAFIMIEVKEGERDLYIKYIGYTHLKDDHTNYFRPINLNVQDKSQVIVNFYLILHKNSQKYQVNINFSNYTLFYDLNDQDFLMSISFGDGDLKRLVMQVFFRFFSDIETEKVVLHKTMLPSILKLKKRM